jgi:eukaryotic-like serine/threonine-protein kinase
MSARTDEATLEGSLPLGDGHTRIDDRPTTFVRGGTIGRYLVLSPVGTGAMGVVLAAYDPELDRKIALKLLKPRGSALRRARERLQREAQALAKLGHPNVVAVYDVGVHDEQLFIAMEFVEGQTLGAWMAAAPAVSTGGGVGTSPKAPPPARPWREVLEVFVQAGRGLAAAHDAGLVHRDFKPDNVMLSRDGRVRVMDFGLARVDDDASDSRRTTDVVGSLTQTGALLGTPAYMPLEQFGGGLVDARSDQFSFCVALHEALYGERPFVGETIGELMGGLLEGAVRVPTRGAAVPGWVRVVVLRGLATKPEDRFPSMPALLSALAADPVARRRRIALRLGLGLALVASTWGVISLSGEVEQREATIEERDAVIGEQASELEQKNAALRREVAEQKYLLSVQLGLRASALVATENEAEALLLGVQAVGAYAHDWTAAPREAVMGLEQVLAHDAVNLEASHILEDHEDYLTYADYSPDGARLATASYDGSVRIWDPVRAQLLTTLDHEDEQVVHVEFSPDGSRLATASKDAKARIWDVASGERLFTLVGHEASLHTLAFAPDGTQIATAGLERSVRVWNVRTGALLLTLAGGGEHSVRDLAYTPDGARLVTAGDDAKARVWDAKTGERLATLVGHEGPILAIAIVPDGTQLATASEDRRARLWALETGALVATLEGHGERVSEIAYSPDGKRVTTVSWDKTGRVYDPATGALVVVLEGGHGAGIATLAYAPDGSSIATGSYGGNVAVWDAERGTFRARLRGHSADIWGLAFAPNGRQLATASVDHTARLWDLGEAWVAALEGPETNVHEFAYSPDEAQLATMSTDGRVRLWASETGERLRTLDEGDEDAQGNLAYSPDGNQLAVASRGLLRIWDPRTGRLLGTTRLGSQDSGVSYSPAGTLLRVSDDRATQIFDARTLEPLATFEHAKDRRYSYALDDSRVAITNANVAVQLRDPRTGALVGQLEAPGDTIAKVVYSPDGTELVTVGIERGLRVWDAHRLTPRLTLESSLGAGFVAYSPDGTRLVGGSGPEGVRIWDSRSGKALLHIEREAQETGTGVALFSPDGSRLVVLSDSGFLRIHDVNSGERLVYIDRLLIEHYHLWRDGKRLTTVDANHALETWDIATGEPLTRERIGIVREDGSIAWPIPPRELTRIGCTRLRVFARSYPEARDICEPLQGE